jgi:hypothetical protein
MTAVSPALEPPVMIAIIIYSLIFPLTQLMGEPFVVVGLLLTSPFLPIAYICGMLVAGLFGSEAGYVVGSCMAVMVQVALALVVVVVVRHARAQKKCAVDMDPY